MDQHPARERLRQYLDGLLNEADSRRIEAHLAGCADVCQPIVDSIADGEASDEWAAVSTVLHGGGETVASDVAREPSPAANCAPLTSSPPGYQILDKLGQGGMGVVYRARQIGANRLVALKMILNDDYAAPADRDRFKSEAEALARLQHPNIVQVFEVGEHDGRPFFSMEYCPGGSLAAKLNGLPLEPRLAAARAETLARAIHAAHQARVIHRDLKPDNMLLTADDTLKVADFGLAKMLDKAGLSSPGVVLGTPSYMAPEQIQTVPADLGPTVDVYALGAVLYELLTGRPPFKATNPVDTLCQVLYQDPVAPSRLNASVPRDLETICLKCLEKNQARRYATADDLADDLRRFQAGEPIKARPVGRLEHGWRWAKRNPMPAGLLAVTLLLVMGLVAGGVWYLQDQAQRRLDRELQSAKTELQQKLAEDRIGTALEHAHKKRADLHNTLKKPGGVFELLNHPEDWEAQIDSAQSSVRHTRSLILLAERGVPELPQKVDAVESLLTQDDNDRKLAMRLAKIRLDRAALVDGNFNAQLAAEEYPRAFAGAGFAISEHNAADVAARIAAAPIREQLVASLDDWALVAIQTKNPSLMYQLLAVARLAAPDPHGGDKLRQVKYWKHPEDIVKEIPVAGLSPQMLDLVGMLLLSKPALRESWLRQAQAQYPGDFWLKLNLAQAVHEKNVPESTAYYWAAISIRPGNSMAYFNVGITLMEQKKLPEAIAAFRKATELDGTYALVHNHLGLALAEQKKLPESIAAFHKAIELNPKSASSHFSLGNALLGQKHLKEAGTAYQEAIQLDPQLAGPHNGLGNLSLEQNRPLEAIAHFEKAIQLDPKLAQPHTGLGNAYLRQKKLPEACAEFLKAIELDPQSAFPHYGLGRALTEQKDLPGAIAEFHKAIELDPNLALPHHGLGIALGKQKNLTGASAAYQKAMELDPKLAEPPHNLGLVFLEQKKLPEALAAFQKSIELDPGSAKAHISMGLALLKRGSFTEAARATKKGLDLLPDGDLLRLDAQDQLKFCEIVPKIEKTVDLVLEEKVPASPAQVLEMARFCLEIRTRYVSAARLYARAIEADPALAAKQRYHAACAASLAGTGLGDEAAGLSAVERGKLRQQALDWLRTDLNVYAVRLKEGKASTVPAIKNLLAHWQSDPDLAGVRDEKGLAQLPPAERQVWQEFWAEVHVLEKQARSK